MSVVQEPEVKWTPEQINFIKQRLETGGSK